MVSLFRTFKRFDSPSLRLVIIGLVSLVIYLIAVIVPANLLKLYSEPHLDGILLAHQGFRPYLRLILAFTCLGLLYWLSYQVAAVAEGKAAWSVVIGGTLIYAITFLFMAPFDAVDIYDNILHGRILGIYSANPFLQLINNYPWDPFFHYVGSPQTPSAYGPLWELLAGWTARLAGNDIIANVMAFKALPGLFHLASVGMVVLILKRQFPKQALGGALLLGWNPIILYETWGNGHNDMAMVIWLLVAAWFLSFRHYTLAVYSLMIGTLFKFIPILVLPIVVMTGWRELDKLDKRLGFIFTAFAGSFLIIIAAYYPFWYGWRTLDVSGRMAMFTTSIPSVMHRALSMILGAHEAGQWVSLSALGLLLVFIVVQALRGGNDPFKEYVQSAFNILAFYLLVACLWFHQWYGVWLITLAPLLPKESRRLALLFGFWVLSQQLFFGPQLVPKILTSPPARAVWFEALLACGVLGVPWAYALWNLWIQRRSPNEEKPEIQNGGLDPSR